MKKLLSTPLRFFWKWTQITALAVQLFVFRTIWVSLLDEGESKLRRIAPRVAWRRNGRIVFYTKTAWLICFIMMMFAPMLAAIIVIPLLFSGPVLRRAQARYEQGIEKGDCELCLECGYVLSGLPTVHTCPECGTAYDIHEVKARWVAYFRAVRKN